MKKYIVFLLLGMWPVILFGQTKDSYQLRLGVGITRDEPGIIPEFNFKMKRYKEPLFGFELAYGFFDNIDIGIYGGYANVMRIYESSYTVDEESHLDTFNFASSDSHALFYGLKANYHLLPLLLEINPNCRFDLFPFLYVGGATDLWPKGSKKKKSTGMFFELNVGIGLDYRITKGFGLFAECGFGRQHYDTWARFKGGLKFSF